MEKNSRCGRESSVEWKPLALYVQASFLPWLLPDLWHGILWIVPSVRRHGSRTTSCTELWTCLPVSERWPESTCTSMRPRQLHSGCTRPDWICQRRNWYQMGKTPCRYGTSGSFQHEIHRNRKRTVGTWISWTFEVIRRSSPQSTSWNQDYRFIWSEFWRKRLRLLVAGNEETESGLGRRTLLSSGRLVLEIRKPLRQLRP